MKVSDDVLAIFGDACGYREWVRSMSCRVLSPPTPAKLGEIGFRDRDSGSKVVVSDVDFWHTKSQSHANPKVGFYEHMNDQDGSPIERPD